VQEAREQSELGAALGDQKGSDKVYQHGVSQTGITENLKYHHPGCRPLAVSASRYGWLRGRETYLSKRNSSVLVFVHFLDDLGGLLFADVEAARLDQALELFARDGTIVVLVE
jgi:hypothetical protein